MSNTALITGASAGIGLEFAKVLAKNNYNLALTARSVSKLEAIRKEITESYKVNVDIFPIDLSVASNTKVLAENISEKGFDINVLINNAGFGEFGKFMDTDWEKEEKMIQLNIVSLTHLTKLFAKEMLAGKGGKIMNVASTAGFLPGPLMAVYYASKAYVLHFSEAIAFEFKNTGITVTCLCPGATASDFQSTSGNVNSKLVRGKKLPSAREVAEFGYKAMMNNKTVAIHGSMNYIMANAVRFIPRKLAAGLVYKAQKEVK